MPLVGVMATFAQWSSEELFTWVPGSTKPLPVPACLHPSAPPWLPGPPSPAFPLSEAVSSPSPWLVSPPDLLSSALTLGDLAWPRLRSSIYPDSAPDFVSSLSCRELLTRTHSCLLGISTWVPRSFSDSIRHLKPDSQPASRLPAPSLRLLLLPVSWGGGTA